jgi:hypothetical protein
MEVQVEVEAFTTIATALEEAPDHTAAAAAAAAVQFSFLPKNFLVPARGLLQEEQVAVGET